MLRAESVCSHSIGPIWPRGLRNGTVSVSLSVLPSVPSIDGYSSVRRVCCWAPRSRRQAISTAPSLGRRAPPRRVCRCGPGSGGRRAPSSNGAAARSTALSGMCEQCHAITLLPPTKSPTQEAEQRYFDDESDSDN